VFQRGAQAEKGLERLVGIDMDRCLRVTRSCDEIRRRLRG
jgi:hypothetical protein